jgi:hypothetical protein
MQEHLRFPSGTTIKQAKKDSKKRAKEKNILLTKAQNDVAKENGLDMNWKSAMNNIKTEDKPLCRFNITGKNFQLTNSKPVGYISGYSGIGKTVTSYYLAEQHLKSGNNVHIDSYGMGINSKSTDFGSTLLRNLISNFESQVTFYDRPRNSGCYDEIEFIDRLPKNTLVIMDEIGFIGEHFPMQRCIQNLQEKDCGILLISQCEYELEKLNLNLHYEEYAGFLLFGKGEKSIPRSRFYKQRSILENNLVYGKGQFTDFIAFDSIREANIIRLNIPTKI